MALYTSNRGTTVTMKAIWYLANLLVLVGLLAGCGGGANTGVQTRKAGKATFVVRWPARNTRLIPIASNSIVVTLMRGQTQVGAPQTLVRPTSGDLTTTATFTNLPVDNLLVTATAFPNSDGTGTAQATGTTILAVQSGVNTSVTLTMGSTIRSVVVSSASSVLVYGNQTTGTTMVSASAQDATGAIVLTSGSTFQWSSSNTRILTVAATGSTATVTGAGIGLAQITATETESNISGQVSIKVRGTGLLAGGWPKFHNNAANNGLGASRAAGNFLVWTASTGGPIESSAVYSPAGVVYFGSGDGQVYALNAADGTRRWTASIGGHIKATPALGSDGTIYAVSTTGQLAALDPTDGTQKWSEGFGESFTSSPTIGPDGTLYICSQSGIIRAIDGATGDQVWTVGIGGTIESSPALNTDGSLLFVGGGDKHLYAVSTINGSQAWSFQTNGAIQSSPTYSAQRNAVYFGSDDGRVFALRATDGTELWQVPFATSGTVSASPVLFDNQTAGSALIVGSTDGSIYAIDPTSGSSIGSPFRTGGAIRSSAAVTTTGTIVVGSDDGAIHLLNFGEGGLFQRTKFATGAGVSASPALDGSDKIYVGSTDNNMYALGVSP